MSIRMPMIMTPNGVIFYFKHVTIWSTSQESSLSIAVWHFLPSPDGSVRYHRSITAHPLANLRIPLHYCLLLKPMTEWFQ